MENYNDGLACAEREVINIADYKSPLDSAKSERWYIEYLIAANKKADNIVDENLLKDNNEFEMFAKKINKTNKSVLDNLHNLKSQSEHIGVPIMLWNEMDFLVFLLKHNSGAISSYDLNMQARTFIETVRAFCNEYGVSSNIKKGNGQLIVERFFVIKDPFYNRLHALIRLDDYIKEHFDPDIHLYLTTIIRLLLLGLSPVEIASLKWSDLNAGKIMLTTGMVVDIDNLTFDMIKKAYQLENISDRGRFVPAVEDGVIKFNFIGKTALTAENFKKKMTLKIAKILQELPENSMRDTKELNKRGFYESMVRDLGLSKARLLLSTDPNKVSPITDNQLLQFAINKGYFISNVAQFKRKMLDVIY